MPMQSSNIGCLGTLVRGSDPTWFRMVLVGRPPAVPFSLHKRRQTKLGLQHAFEKTGANFSLRI
jgi:hypothetical protein